MLGAFLPAGSFLSDKCTTGGIAGARVAMGTDRCEGRFGGPHRVVSFSGALQCTSGIRSLVLGLGP